MIKLTGDEKREELPAKVILLYETIGSCIYEDIDILNLTVSEIATKAGIGKGTVYEYFETKEQLLVYAMMFIAKEMFRNMEKMVITMKGFRQQVEFLLEGIEQQTEMRTYFLKYANMVIGSTSIGASLKENLSSVSPKKNEPISLVYTILEEGLKNKELRVDLPMQYMGYILITKMIGFMVYLNHPSETMISAEEFRKLIVEGIVQELMVR